MKKSKQDNRKGCAIRLSNEVLNVLGRKMRKGESYDNLMRRMLGMPTKKAKPQPIEVFWLLPKALTVKKTLAEARGEAIILAVRRGKKNAEKPMKVIQAI